MGLEANFCTIHRMLAVCTTHKCVCALEVVVLYPGASKGSTLYANKKGTVRPCSMHTPTTYLASY